MQLQNFECQIAKAQIGRYVAGDILSEEALQQLEAHVWKCPDCKQNLAERRATLQAMLTPNQESGTETSTKTKFDLASFIKSRVRTKQPVQAAVQLPTTKPTAFTKPAMYSIALGAVLIGMSYVSKNMTSVLGPKAADSASHAAVTPPEKVTPPVMATLNTTDLAPAKTNAFDDADAIAIGNPIQEPTDLATTAPTKEATPVEKPKSDHRAERKRSHKNSSKKPHHSANVVRVYAPEN